MNIIDIIVLAILAFSMISGMYKGFLTSTLALLGFCGSWIGAMSTYKYLSAAIERNDGIMGMLTSLVDSAEIISNRALANTNVLEAANEQIEQVAAQLNLSGVKQMFAQKVAEVKDAAAQLTSQVTLSDCLTDTVLTACLNVFCFVVMFIVIYAAALLIVNLLNNVFRFPALRHFDWLCGGVFGILRGAVVVLLVFSVIPAISSLLNNLDIKLLDTLLADSAVAKYIGDTNVISGALNKIIF